MTSLIPLIGTWYQEIQQDIIFEVVAIDDRNQTIEAQLLEGEITEFDFDVWNVLVLHEIEESEDWRNGYELASEDAIDPDTTVVPQQFTNPLIDIEPLYTHGLEE